MEEQGDAPAAAPVDPVVAAMTAVRDAAAQARSVNLWAGSDATARERLLAIADAQAVLGSLFLRGVYDLDTREGAVPGAATGKVAATFLVHALRRDPGRARADVAAAHTLADAELLADQPADDLSGLPLIGSAFAAGEISREHVDAAVGAYEKIPAHLLDKTDEAGRSGRARVDELLAEHARAFNPSTSAFLARHLLNVLDPDGRDRFDPDSLTRRHLSLKESPDAMTLLTGQADPASAAWIRAGLEHFSRQQPDRHLERDDEDGQQILPIKDRRTQGQRTLDALVAMVRLAMGSPEAGTCAGEPPHVSVHAELDTLSDVMPEVGAADDDEQHDEHCRDADGRSTDGADTDGGNVRSAKRSGANALGLHHVRSRHAARLDPRSEAAARLLGRLICDSAVQTIVTGKQGQILDIGRLSRAVPLRLRKLVTARDRGCVICNAPPSQCDAHHVRFWRDGGETGLSNLALLCGRCHTLVHLGIWEVRMRRGVAQIRPPDWLDADRHWWTPRPAQEHEAATRARQLALDLEDDDAA